MTLHSLHGELHPHALQNASEATLPRDASWQLRNRAGAVVGQVHPGGGHDVGATAERPEGADNGVLTWRLPATTVRWDPVSAQLELQRAPCGTTPLFHVQHDGRLYFATDLPRLLALLPGYRHGVDPLSLLDILAWGRILPPYTMYRDVYCIEPGSSLICKADEQTIHCKARRDWNWAREIARRLDLTVLRESVHYRGNAEFAQDARRVAFELDADLHGRSETNGNVVQKLLISADDTCNAIPGSISAGWTPLGDIAEAAFSAALPAQKDLSVLECDLSGDLLRVLATVPGQTSDQLFSGNCELPLSFMGTRRLRSHFASWRAMRAGPLLQALHEVQHLVPDRMLRRDALFRLLYVLPDRRMRLYALARKHQRQIVFDCASPEALAGLIAHSLRGHALPADASPVPQMLISSERLSRGGTGVSPYDRAIALYLNRDREGIDYMTRYFRLSQWNVRDYMQRCSTALGSAIEQRLCAILSVQYLLNFT